MGLKRVGRFTTLSHGQQISLTHVGRFITLEGLAGLLVKSRMPRPAKGKCASANCRGLARTRDALPR